MDALDAAFIRFWQVLNNRGVRYIRVRGIATRFHGYNRATDDIHI